ncbi:MAG: hypothetical protein RLZ98_340 [Pseudomonadota bacterium]|jgi:regulator of sigma E protease
MLMTLSGLASGIWGNLSFLLAFLFVLTVVVFVHELGHFLVARWCGVKVTTFSIGFGPEIAGFYDRQGTRWRIAWIPLGGYVKFMDDENAASVPSHEAIKQMSAAEQAGSFHAKPLWQRTAVVAAGPLANFLLAIAIFAVMAMFWGITIMEPRVGRVVDGTPAAKAGFQPGDLVVSIDGNRIEEFSDLQRIIVLSPGRDLEFVIDRNGERKTLKVKPEMREHNDKIAGKTTRPVIGIQSSSKTARVITKDVGPVEAVVLGTERTWQIITGTLTYLGDVVMRRQNADQLGGPIRIADVSGKVAALGFGYLINLVAVLSVSVGLINLFPIPMLDGGHLMFYAIEAVRRRPLTEQTQEFGYRIGLAIVLMLMVFTTFNDLPILKGWLFGTG